MENKEFTFKGIVMNGFLMLFFNIFVLLLTLFLAVQAIIQFDAGNGDLGGWLLGGSFVLLIINIIMWCGFMMLEPNEARVLTWFGKYSGTFAQAGYFWVNPFYGTKRVSLRAQGGQSRDDWIGIGVEIERHL